MPHDPPSRHTRSYQALLLIGLSAVGLGTIPGSPVDRLTPRISVDTTLRTDADRNASQVMIGSAGFRIVKRVDSIGVRAWDSERRALKAFAGLEHDLPTTAARELHSRAAPRRRAQARVRSGDAGRLLWQHTGGLHGAMDAAQSVIDSALASGAHP